MLFAHTLGSFGTAGAPTRENLHAADVSFILPALISGVLFNLSNTLLAEGLVHHIMMHHASFRATLGSMTISLRNLPPEVEKAILETSHREGISLNKATLRLLQASLRKPFRNSDFDEFFGTWSKEEADEFDAALAEMRQVDPADWEPVE